MRLDGAFEAKVVSVDWPKKRAKIVLTINPGQQYTARMVRGIWTQGLRSKPTVVDGGGHPQWAGDGVHSHGEHTHQLADLLKAGDLVLVVFMHGRSDSPVIVDLF